METFVGKVDALTAALRDAAMWHGACRQLTQINQKLHAKIDELEAQNERVRRALADHSRDRASLERIESKLDALIGNRNESPR